MPRDQFAEAEELAAQAERQYAGSLHARKPARADELVQRAAALAEMAQARALLAIATALGAHSHPARETDGHSVRAPLLRIRTRTDTAAGRADP
jgi:hypothetical protein